MISRKLLAAVGLLTTATAAVVAGFTSQGGTLGFSKAIGTDKEFTYNSSVASQVEYGGSSTTQVRNVTTGISTPIATKLYREAGERSDYFYLDKDYCFYFVQWSNQRTYAFEVGLNNLIGFEIQFKYSYREERDTGLMDPLSYNLTLTFYSGKNVVGTANYSLDKTTRETVYTHTWTKDDSITEKIDYVKCSLANGGGGNKDEGRSLTLYYYKVWWSC